MKGRPPDPARGRRGTGNRDKPGVAKKVATGVVVASRTRKAEVVEQFPPPDTLPQVVHDVWRAAVDDLGGASHMRASFLPVLDAYCRAVYVHAQASANIEEIGLLVQTPFGIKTNPLLKTQKDAASTILRLSETLGLTPAARIRLGLMEITGMSLLAGINASIDGKV